MILDSTYGVTPDIAKANVVSKGEEDRLREACQGFEALLIHKMFQNMRSAVEDGGLIKKSNAEKIFEDMFDEQLAFNMSETSSGGLADIMFESMKEHLPSSSSSSNTDIKKLDDNSIIELKEGSIINITDFRLSMLRA